MIRRGNIEHSPESSLKEEIASRISEHQFVTWFRKLKFEFVGPNRVSILVPNNFYQEYLKSRFLPVIQESVEAVTELGSIEIQFSVDQSLAHSESETQTSNDNWRQRPWSDPQLAAIAHQPNTPEDASTRPRDPNAPARDHHADDLLKSPTISQVPKITPVTLPDNIPLNSDYTFDEFITGPSNRLAHAACKAVSEEPGTSYNPLFLYGRVGLGKTHLLQAVAHAYVRRGYRNVVYLSCASFTNDFIAAVSNHDLDRFRRKYREADALLIDDIHFLAKKERTQEEFFHTFNSIYNQQKQILLTSDCMPAEISGLSERLISRFKLGLVTQVSPPNFETRMAILRRKAEKMGIHVPEDVAEFVVHRIRDNIREIEGAVLRIHTLVKIENKDLNIDEVRHSLSDLIGQQDRRVTLLDIQQAVLEEFQVRPADLHSRKRTRSIVVPRQICMYLARKHTDLSLGEIGIYFGGRDHSTVLHGITKIRTLKDQDARIRNAIANIENDLSV